MVKSTLRASIIDLASFFGQLKSHVDEKIMLPGREYANLMLLKSWLGRAEGEIIIVDKDLDEDGLDVLYTGLRDAIESGKLTSIKILCHPWKGEALRSSSLKKHCKVFQNEISKKDVSVEFRVLNDEDAKDLHNRYTIMWTGGQQILYDHPPYNIIVKKMGNISPVESDRAKVQIALINTFWKRATKLENYKWE